MENVLNTVKEKVKTTKVLAIVGVILIILGLFFNVGRMHFKLQKEDARKSIEAEVGDYASYFGDDYITSQLDSLEKMAEAMEFEETAMNYWGGYAMLILGVVALALVFIDFVKAKLPVATAEKIKFWDVLKNKKLITLVAAVILVLLVVTWTTPLKKEFADSVGIEMKEVNDELKEGEENFVKAKYSLGTGFIFIFLGAVSLGAYPFLYKPEETVAEAQPAEENVDPVSNNE